MSIRQAIPKITYVQIRRGELLVPKSLTQECSGIRPPHFLELHLARVRRRRENSSSPSKYPGLP